MALRTRAQYRLSCKCSNLPIGHERQVLIPAVANHKARAMRGSAAGNAAAPSHAAARCPDFVRYSHNARPSSLPARHGVLR